MKIYNLNIDTSKPVNKVMQMQQNETGLLKLNVTNDGKSILNLTTKVYDGETEVPSTDNGFKIDMGKNDKVVKVEAMGENTDYQLDTTIRPSVNAPYDGDYTEPLTEVEVDGVKFVPTTLTIDGVEYKVLVEEQPEPEGIVLSRPAYVFDPETDDPSTFPKQIGYLPAGEYAQEEVIRWLSAFAVDVDVGGTQAKTATLVFAENEQTPPENSNIVMANLIKLGDGSGDQIQFMDGRMQPISSEGLNLVITGDGIPVWWGASLMAQYYMDCPAVSVTVQQTTQSANDGE